MRRQPSVPSAPPMVAASVAYATTGTWCTDPRAVTTPERSGAERIRSVPKSSSDRSRSWGSRRSSPWTVVAVSIAAVIDVLLRRGLLAGGGLLEPLSESPQRVVDARLGGTDRDAERVGDLGEAAPPEVDVDQDLPAGRGEPGERVLNGQRGDDPVHVAGRGRHERQVLVAGLLRAGTAPAQLVDDQVAGDRGQPVVAAVRPVDDQLRGTPGAQERLLRDVLGQV